MSEAAAPGRIDPDSGSGGGVDAGELVKPPALRLLIGAVCALTSLALFVSEGHASHLVGYALGTVLTILAVADFRRTDARRSASPLYSPVPWLNYAAVAVLLVGIGCGIGHIYYLAQRTVG